jgi:hypothetical protein
MRLAHGPWYLRLSDPPALSADVAGRTWDGGPAGAISLVGGLQNTLPELLTTKGAASAVRLDPIPLLDFADEGAVGVEAVGREAYDPSLLRIVGPWDTFGPVDGPAPVFENTQRYRQWIAASQGAMATGWAAFGVRAGASPSLFTDVLRFRRATSVLSMRFARLVPDHDSTIVVGSPGNPRVITVDPTTNQDIPLGSGSWFALYGKRPTNTHLFENRGEALRVLVGPTVDLVADMHERQFRAGETYAFQLSALAFPLDTPVDSPDEVVRYIDYLRDPIGLRLTRGARVQSPGLLEVSVDQGAVDLSLPRPDGVPGLTLPLRVTGLHSRWSAGLLQVEGYSPGFYGAGDNRYRSLGIDADGAAYVPLYVNLADRTHVLVGHPIVADDDGRNLFIQVTCLGGTPFRWHVSVNNPEDRPVTTTLRKAMDLPGLDFPDRRLTLPSGAYLVIR